MNIKWDCYIGKQVTFQDANSASTTYAYYGDPFDRLLAVKQSSGVSATETHMAFTYPSLTQAVTSQDQVALDDGKVVTTSIYDGLGRPSETQRGLGGGAYSSVKQTYDGKGRAYQSTLPHTNSETVAKVTTLYDGINRVLSVTTDDSASTTTTYDGASVTTTDAKGNARVATMDGLGRLSAVVEDPTPGKNYQTSYLYDLLDDLTTVTQGALTRTFQYNWQKQLISASNPETGLICYGPKVSAQVCGTESYDGNGNLTLRTDNLMKTTSYSYDPLNRLTGKTYADNVTPNVTLSYDGSGAPTCPGVVVANVGRLTKVATSNVGGLP